MNTDQETTQAAELRRVAIYLTVPGTAEDANAIRDAIGEALDDELLVPIIVRVMLERDMEGKVDYEVKGERWIPEEAGEAPVVSAGDGW